MFMKTHGYSSDELKTFNRVLDSAIVEAAERCLDVSVGELVKRLFTCADLGERDPNELRAAILRGNENSLI